VVGIVVDGAEVHVEDRGGATALDFAVDFGHASIVTYLVKEQGVDPNRLDERGWTPLIRCGGLLLKTVIGIA
jgi:ankyrin repeat protein